MSAKWMIVYEATDVNEAQIVAGRLEVDGIKALVNQPTMASVFGLTLGQMGNTTVAVRPEDYERALKLLEPDEQLALNDDNERVIYSDSQPDDDRDPE
jgi:Putative prokaryotic signal transducing protein